jgi:glycosyltransferase involved in cell wall biosynthesis
MFGRPVIASAIAGLKERVVPGQNGFTFPPRDARALADLLASLVGDERKWQQAHRGIEPPWSEAEMLEAHLSVWKEFAASRDAPPEQLEAEVTAMFIDQPQRRAVRRKKAAASAL